MIDKLGPVAVWFLFLGSVWLWARPALVFVAAVLIVGLVIVGVVHKLEAQGDQLVRSWHKEDR
jgi:hypothetical protein